ncbi:EVE domain-containing protein [Candidatus Pelagibacter sp.]|nr:EVE domain-containing protein [Candidatus Pelagibacter sp.]
MRNNIETNYLIFISSDGKRSGFDIFNERVQENKWPIYNRTPQLRNVKEGKNVVFYIAGTGEKRQSFIGSAKIKSIIDIKNTTIDNNQEFKEVLFHVEFKELKIFDKDVYIKDHIDNLEFIENKEKYGLYFQGGICKIDQISYNYIQNKAFS